MLFSGCGKRIDLTELTLHFLDLLPGFMSQWIKSLLSLEVTSESYTKKKMLFNYSVSIRRRFSGVLLCNYRDVVGSCDAAAAVLKYFLSLLRFESCHVMESELSVGGRGENPFRKCQFQDFLCFILIPVFKEDESGLPWWSSGWHSELPLQWARVQSLVEELSVGSCMP